MVVKDRRRHFLVDNINVVGTQPVFMRLETIALLGFQTGLISNERHLETKGPAVASSTISVVTFENLLLYVEEVRAGFVHSAALSITLEDLDL